MSGILVSLFKYKGWANAELFAALRSFDVKRHPSEFHAMLQVLDHVNVVDRIFQGHLIGSAAVFKATRSEQTPSLQELHEVVNATDDWYLKFVSTISPERLPQRLSFTFTDGNRGSMSCEEMLLHVITHGGYHRGSVGQMLEDMNLGSPPDSLTKYLHWHEPERRLSV
jgi:uncharacterized damage-inducible protein DinB